MLLVKRKQEKANRYASIHLSLRSLADDLLGFHPHSNATNPVRMDFAEIQIGRSSPLFDVVRMRTCTIHSGAPRQPRTSRSREIRFTLASHPLTSHDLQTYCAAISRLHRVQRHGCVRTMCIRINRIRNCWDSHRLPKG